MLRLASLVLTTTLLSGCATVLDRAAEPIVFDSDPSGASLRVSCPGRPAQEAVTPAVIHIERRSGDCLVEVSRDGHMSQRVTLEQGMNRRILWNLLPMGLGLAYAASAGDNLSGGAGLAGGLLFAGGGFLVDWISGRNADHDPKRVTLKLQPHGASLPAP